MPDLPHQGVVVLVRHVRADGTPVAQVVSGGQERLAVDAFVSGGSAVGTVHKSEFTDNLALGVGVDRTSAWGAGTKAPGFVAVHFSAPLPQQQTLKIFFKPATAGFETLVEQWTLPVNTTDYVFAFPAEFPLDTGDQIRLTITNTGTPAVTANSTLQGKD